MKLLESYHLGGLPLKNRMAMAPMTRSRADMLGIVGKTTELYYTQRASAGLIITEAINISNEAQGSPLTPGIFTPGQIQAWKNVTKSVHEAGGVIVAQLWHTGRVGHSLVKNGELPVAPSAIAIQGQQHFTIEGLKDYETPRELSTEEVKSIVKSYKQAAINAMEAGFDGVELHAAFGYLPNQFLADSSNQRMDEYGGSHENKNRFVIEIMEEIVESIGPGKAAIRISPTSTYNGIVHKEPIAQFNLLVEHLNTLPLLYLHIMNVPFSSVDFPNYPANSVEIFGSICKHPIIANCGYTRESGEEEIQKGIAQMVAYGTLFLANPDLPKRFESNSSLNTLDRSTMYGGQEEGYIDYPFLEV